jgi:hypothetical protein
LEAPPECSLFYSPFLGVSERAGKDKRIKRKKEKTDRIFTFFVVERYTVPISWETYSG